MNCAGPSPRISISPVRQILLGHGSDELIHNIGLAFLAPGDEVLMCTGPFSQYEFTAKLMDALP